MKFANKQIEQIPLDNLTTAQFLTIAIETSTLLGWIFGDINASGFVAYTNNGVFSWNAEIRLKINDKMATVQSASRGDGVIDVRGNKKNIQGFTLLFNSLKKTLQRGEVVSTKYDNFKTGFSSN